MKSVYTVEWDKINSNGDVVTNYVSWYAIHSWMHFVRLKRMSDVVGVFVRRSV